MVIKVLVIILEYDRLNFLSLLMSMMNAAVLQQQRKVQDLQQQHELEMSRVEREHERDIEALTRELKNNEQQLEQQQQRKVVVSLL